MTGLFIHQRSRHRSEASLIIHLVGYLHGTWLQFEDWFFDARVPVVQQHNMHVTAAVAENFLSHSFAEWRRWKGPDRTHFTNILFMFNRAASYEWDLEHFAIEYMILDACYKAAVELDHVPDHVRHYERIDVLCQRYGIARNSDLAKNIVTLRNHLFHEALWDKKQPGTAASHESFFAPLHLRRLNRRLVLALLNYQNEYLRSCWWTMSPMVFGMPSTS